MTSMVLKITNTVAFVCMIIINALANLLPLGIGTTGAVSEKYPNLFTPAPVTFAIWGIIYLMMAIFVVYQWGVFDKGTRSKEITERIGPWFVVSCFFNIAWIFAWHFDIILLSVLFMLLLLCSLIIITRMTKGTEMRFTDKVSVKAGFDIYFGWIIAATIANISVFLTSLKWNGFGISSTVWTVIILIVGSVIGFLASFLEHRKLTTLAVIWAYVGIMIKHISVSGHDAAYPAIITAAAVSILIMLCGIFISFMKCRGYRKMKEM